MLLVAVLSARGDDALDQLIAQARTNNPSLAAARRMWEAKGARIPAMRSLPDPMAGVDVERSDTKLADYNDLEFMIQQDLPGPGKRAARTRTATLEAEVEGFKYLELSRSVKADVTAAWWELWLKQEERAIMGDSIKLMEQMESAARDLYQSGQATQRDILRAQIERSRMSNEIVTVEAERHLVAARINSLVNDSSGTPRRVTAEPERPALPKSLDAMLEQARKYCCILIATMRAREAKVSAVKSARLEARPDFQLRAEARQFEGGGITEYDTGLFVNLPWIWRGKYRAMVAEAQAEADAASSEFDAEVNMTLVDIRERYTMTETALRSLELTEKILLPQAERLVESARAGYTSGKGSLLEVLDAVRIHVDTRMARARALRDYGVNHARLESIASPWGPFEFETGLVTPDMK